MEPVGYEGNLDLAKGDTIFYKVQADPPECAVPAIVDTNTFAGMTGRWIVLQEKYFGQRVKYSGRIVAGFNEMYLERPHTDA